MICNDDDDDNDYDDNADDDDDKDKLNIGCYHFASNLKSHHYRKSFVAALSHSFCVVPCDV
jgi:hypothetical protein